MTATKGDTIARLKRDILLQDSSTSLRPVAVAEKNTFPYTLFNNPGVHEFLYSNASDAAATGGFVAGILAGFLNRGGATIWISPSSNIFPPALSCFGLAADKIIFIYPRTEKEILWIMEEALGCETLSAVVAETTHLSFTASRRLQLVMEKTTASGFILRPRVYAESTTACTSRWRINTLPGILDEGMPGVGFPAWQATLLRLRNGKTGCWPVAWIKGRFQTVMEPTTITEQQHRKTG